jgi:hypothetical protein
VATVGDQDLHQALGSGVSWDDVMESMQLAKESQDDKVKQKNIRSLPRNRTIITTLDLLTAMIPEEKGLSVLKGGLSLVFKVNTTLGRNVDISIFLSAAEY